jgi:hypothetical protein
MATAWKVKGADPKKSFLANAQVVLPTRLAELSSWERAVHDPHNVRDLHNMRISAKRLRYSMELYRICFENNYQHYLDAVKTIQELLGKIHDCDVMVDFLIEYCAKTEQRRRRRAAKVKQQSNLHVTSRPTQMAFPFITALGDARPIRKLIAARRRERTRTYKKFVALWDHLTESDFQSNLLKLIRQAGMRVVPLPKHERTNRRIVEASAPATSALIKPTVRHQARVGRRPLRRI